MSLLGDDGGTRTGWESLALSSLDASVQLLDREQAEPLFFAS